MDAERPVTYFILVYKYESTINLFIQLKLVFLQIFCLGGIDKNVKLSTSAGFEPIDPYVIIPTS